MADIASQIQSKKEEISRKEKELNDLRNKQKSGTKLSKNQERKLKNGLPGYINKLKNQLKSLENGTNTKPTFFKTNNFPITFPNFNTHQQNNSNIGFKSKKDRRDKEDKLRIKGKEVVKNLDRIKKTIKKITKITKKRNRYSKRYLELLENIDETLKHLYYKTESGDSKHVKTKSKKKYKRNKSSTSSS